MRKKALCALVSVMIIIGLAACGGEKIESDADKYNYATDLQDSGDYIAATQTFRDLGDYKDASIRKQESAALAIKDYVKTNSTGIAMTEDSLGEYRLVYNSAISEDVQENEKAFIAINGKDQICIGDYFEYGSVSTGSYFAEYAVLVLNENDDDISINCISIIAFESAATWDLFTYNDKRKSIISGAELNSDATGSELIRKMGSDEVMTSEITLGESNAVSSLNKRYQGSIKYAEVMLQKMGLTLADLGLGEE